MKMPALRYLRLTLILCQLVFLSLLLLIWPRLAQAGGEVTDCSGYESIGNGSRLQDMLDGGGLVTFNCGPATIIISPTIIITQTTEISGGGIITLSGEGNSDGIFSVTSADNLDFTLSGLNVIKGEKPLGDGGAVRFEVPDQFTKTLTIINSTFSENSALQGGAIYALELNFEAAKRSQVIIENSTFTNNRALQNLTGYGGAVHLDEVATSTIRNSTFYSNSTNLSDGAGIAITTYGVLTLTNNTILSNTGSITGGGGGLATAGGFASRILIDVENSIIAGNGGGNCKDILAFSFDTFGENFDTDGTCTGFATTTIPDLNLGPLSDNGGETETIPLLSGSVAIDAVPAGECTVATDQRGVARPQNSLCDVGAFELATGVNLQVDKTVTPTGPIIPGQTITYTISFANIGVDPASAVVLTDLVPISVTVTDVTSSGVAITDTGATPAFVWDIQDLAPNDSGLITITAVVSPDLAPATTFTNTAIITTASAAIGNTIDEVAVTIASISDLVITKTVSPTGPVLPGDLITYTLAFSNAGSEIATNVSISDVIPAEVVVTGIISSGAAITDTGVDPAFVWAVQDLDPDQGGLITVTANISPNLTSDLIFTNTAVITTSAIDSNPDNNSSAVGLVVNTPLLTISKVVTPETDVAFRSEVTYTISLSNSGTGNAVGVLVTDTLPLSTTFARWVDQPAGAIGSSSGITWSGTITAGEALTLTFVVSHTGSYSDVVTNTAQFSHTAGISVSNVATFTVLGPPAVTLLPPALDFGNQIVGTTSPTQTLTLSNTGASAVDLFAITISSSFSQTNNCPATLVSNSSCTIDVVFQPTVTGAHTGTITVTTNAPTSPHTATLSGVGVTPSLTLFKSVTPTTNVAFHGEVTYTLNLSNTGLGDAVGILLTDTLPLSTTFARWIDQPAGATESGNQITWSGTVSGSQSLFFRFVMTHTGSYSDVITNTATFSYSGVSRVSTVATFRVAGPPGVTLVPTSLNFGNQTVGTTSSTRTVTLTNTGTSSLDISAITISGNFSQTNNCPPALTSNSSCVIQISFTPTAAGLRTGTLTVTTNAPTGPHTVALSGVGVTPSLGITKSVTPQVNVALQGAVTYTVVLSNAGAGNASGVLLTDTLPISITFARWVTQPAGATESGNQITWSGTVNGNQAVTFTFVATHTGSYGDVISNTTIFSHSSGSDVSNAATFTVVGPPAVTLVPTTLDFGNQLVGTSSLTRTVTLTNSGGAPLTVTDITISGSFSQTNTCPPVLSGGSSCTIGVVFNPVGPGFVTGTLTVTTDAASSPDTVALSGTGVFPPDLAIDKSVTPQSEVPYRSEVTYTVTLSNTGLGDADGLLVTDTLPANTDFVRWVDQPSGAAVNNDQITWSGTVSSGTVLTFTFVVSHTGNYSDTVVNTVEFDRAGISGTAQATFTVISDTTPPFFFPPALITPTGNITVETSQPVFDWTDAFDTQSGVVSYTLAVTSLDGGTSFTAVVTESTFTPGFNLSNGIYLWTVQAFDAAGNSSGFVTPSEQFVIDFSTELYLPVLLHEEALPDLPDMVIDNISVLNCVANTCTVRVVARNQSSTPVTFGNNFYVNVYQDGDITTPIIVFGVQASWFGAGESRVLEEVYTFTPGAHTLLAWADAFNTVVETDETNNTDETSITISGLENRDAPANPVLPAGPQPTPTNTP